MRFDIGNVYDFYQHGDCAVIYIGEKEIAVRMCSDSVQYSLPSKKILKKEACIIYNKEKTKVKSWGDLYFQYKNQEYICVNDFREKLYQLFQKEENTWDQDDLFLIQAVSELVRLTVEEAMKLPGIAIEHTDALHYVFVVPSHWQENVAKNLVQSVFSQACLISAQDHDDRILLCSEVESICYLLERNKRFSFQTGRHTVLSRLTAVEQDTVLVKLDLVSTMKTLFDSKELLMAPRVLRSIDLLFTYQGIKNCIKKFFRRLLFDGTESVEQDALLDDIAEFKFNIGLLKSNNMDRFEYDDTPSYEKYVYGRPELTDVQKAIVRSIRPIDLCDCMSKTLFLNMMDLLSNHFEKEYKLLVVQDSYSYRVSYHHFPLERRCSLLGWIYIMLEYNRQSLSSSTIVIEPSVDVDPISLEYIVAGASYAAMEIVCNSNKYRKPRIVESKHISTSSSIFLNSKPNAIVNIDISCKSTVLSYSLMNDDVVIEKLFDHDHFTDDKALVSLGSFFDMSRETILNIEEHFIPFVDKYFSDVGYLYSNKEDISLQFETILNDTFSTDKALISTTQEKYIKAFIFMYLVYIRKLLLSKLPRQVKPDNTDINVGYAISIESKLLEKTIGSTESLKDIVFESDLVQKNENSKKLIIITQEEKLVSKIQDFFVPRFPVKFYFIMAQFYQDYIQLTLRQAVSESKGLESIVVQEKTVPMPDIYNSLSLKMWEKVTKDNDLIQLCDLHNQDQISEMISSSNIKTMFSSNFKQYISSKVFAQDSDLKSSEANMIPLSSSCNCKIRLTMNDILDFSIKPVLSILSNSVTRKNLFENYTDINYIFGLIHFNDNSQLQSTIVDVLQKQADQFNRTTDTSFLIVPDLPQFLLKPIIKQQSLLYKTFQVGRLHQVYTGNYTVSVNYTGLQKLNFSFSNQKMDKESNEENTHKSFLIVKKGEKISKNRLEKLFYFKTDEDIFPDRISIAICKIELADGLEYEKFDLRGAPFESVFNTSVYFKQEEYNAHFNVPMIIYIEPQTYSSSIKFSIRVRGKLLNSSQCLEIAEPLTLMRF